MTPLEEWFYELPIITRTYITLVFAETIACQLDFVNPYQLHFSYDLIFVGHQYWRLLTSFLYFGGLSIDFLFHMFFLVRYSRSLEDGYFRGRTVDFAWMLMLSMAAIVTITPIFSPKANSIPFLSSPLNFVLIYLWSRTNPTVMMHFFGLFVISAAYLPWVFLGFSLIVHGVWPTADLVGLMVGHTYFFLDDIWPRGGGAVVAGVRMERPRIVRAPAIVKQLVAVDFAGGRGAGFGGVDANLPVAEFGDEAQEPFQAVPGATGDYEVWNPDGGDHAANGSESTNANELRRRQTEGNHEEED
ncbi:hypothetical protein HDU98_004861 [Podochytrium sp. JEL0797]|nr:hypothetical protein HDU98_004861 [Podochytrium sp. JEL0797]